MKDTCVHYQQILDFSKKNGLVQNSSIVLGLSGGPDSIFLLHFLASLHHEGFISLIAAHLDHQWRADSAQDEALCRAACQQLSIPFVTQRVSDLSYMVRDNGSQEDKARQQRRFFFEQVRQAHHADYIALGHHADDQQETFFIRLLRGTSLTGLIGMRAQVGVYIRPLLCLTKAEIVSYLDAHQIVYAVDSTNASNDFLRNRLRNTVLPALKQVDCRFPLTFAKTIEKLQEAEAFIDTYAQQQYAQLINQEQGQPVLNILLFKRLDPLIQHRVIIQWLREYGVQFPVSNGFFIEMIDFLQTPRGGTHVIHHDWQIVKKNQKASLHKK